MLLDTVSLYRLQYIHWSVEPPHFITTNTSSPSFSHTGRHKRT